MLFLELGHHGLVINGQETGFHISKTETIRLAETFSEIFSVRFDTSDNERIEFDGKRDNYDYSYKEIKLESDIYQCFDDEHDTNHIIEVCGKTCIIERTCEWIPDRLDNVFLALCRAAMDCNSTTFRIILQGSRKKDYYEFIKPDVLGEIPPRTEE